ncbi:MAG: DUF2752 domain-containing protein [Planctomycetes bacterium]|nr:DUF2752 domain-containing protein [Planctomycetota bacterium]
MASNDSRVTYITSSSTSAREPDFYQGNPSVENGKLGNIERLGLLAVLSLLVILLATAKWLSPDPSGMGTHQQLGLPACTMLAFSGVRCPGCGMTTSWAHTMDGNFVEAFQTNAAGSLLCWLCIACVPIMASVVVAGKRTRDGWASKFALSGFLAAMTIALIEWGLRLLVR